MTDLTIRDLPEAVHRRLSEQAAEHGRTPEDEARAALEEQYAPGAADARTEFWLKDAEAAIAETQAAIRAANGGELPTGVVDEFLADKRRYAAEEFARVERYVRGDKSAV